MTEPLFTDPPPPPPPRSELRAAEHDMLVRLRARHSRISRNGGATIPQGVFVPHVRSDAGFDARRTLDGIAMELWPSRGLRLIGYEVKCSRGDWLRELKDPSKAGEFIPLLDQLWVAVSDARIVASGELPEGWGLLVPHGVGLRVQTPARDLHAPAGVLPHGARAHTAALPPGFNRGFLAALLREAARVGAGIK